MKLNDIYHFIRKLLFEILLYFLLQSILFIVLGVLILIYPYTLNILVALAFFISSLIGLYVMVRIAILFHKAKEVKEAVIGK